MGELGGGGGGDDHIDEAQRLLGGVARARGCLLAAESKARYDAEIAITLDSLPEAEEETSETPDDPDMNPIQAMKPSGSRRPAAAKGRKKSSSRRTKRSTPSKSSSRSGNKSSSLQVKIIAAAVPAVLGLIVLIVLLSSGGGGKTSKSETPSRKTAKNSSRQTKSSSSKPSPRNNQHDSAKADAIIDRFNQQASDNSTSNSSTPKPKPRDESIEPATISSIPAEQTSPTEETTSTEITGAEIPETELSEEDKARRRLKNQYELEEEDFEHTWHLANEQTRKLEALETSRSSGNTGAAEFEAELKRRVDAKKKEILQRWSQIWNATSDNNGPLDREWYHIVNTGVVMFHDNPSAWYVRDEVPEITSIRTQVEQEFASRKPATVDPGKIQLIKDVRTRYAELAQKAEVIDLLEKAGGTLAKPPILPEPASDKPEQPISLSADDANATQDDVASAEKPPSAEEDGATDDDDAPEKTIASFDELKEKLTSLEEEIETLRDNFNSEANDYKKKKSGLSKRIKAGEKLHANGAARLRRMPEYTEAERLKKREAGKEFEKKISGPLKALKSERDKIAKPKAATPLEEKLKQAEKLIEQLEATSEYAENSKSVDSLAAAIAKIRKGFENQQSKMAK